jgi:hypothetical protein
MELLKFPCLNLNNLQSGSKNLGSDATGYVFNILFRDICMDSINFSGQQIYFLDGVDLPT